MLHPILRILFGLLFITSAVLKLFPLDYFELILVQQVGIGWSMVPWLARAIILFEFFIGTSIVFGFKTKLNLQASLAMLVFFSTYIITQVLLGNGEEDCGCFGELIPMDGPTSLAKNGDMFVFGLYLLWKLEELKKWSVGIVSPILFILAIPALLIALPIPTIEPDEDFQLDYELLSPYFLENSKESNQQIYVIMYAKCHHCEKLASLISKMDPSEVNDRLRLVILGGEDKVEAFVEKTGIQAFPFARSGERALVAAINGTFPALALVENEEVVSKWTGKEINIVLLSDLLDL